MKRNPEDRTIMFANTRHKFKFKQKTHITKSTNAFLRFGTFKE